MQKQIGRMNPQVNEFYDIIREKHQLEIINKLKTKKMKKISDLDLEGVVTKSVIT